MTIYWHGYVAFQKPAAVDAPTWAAALVALKAELDETPAASNPAERWHAVTNAATNTTIAEAMFDLTKLNTADLSTLVGFDMSGAWEPMRMNQDKERSMVTAHTLISARSWNLNGYTEYLPEDYGTVDGDPAHDTAAIQAAIDAAVAAGGGRVVCNGTYELAQSGTLTAQLIIVDYALHVDGDNVGIEGAGTLQMNSGAVPTSNKFTAILFGNGGGAGGKPGESGTWRYNNWIKDVHINGTALSVAQRQGLCTSAFSQTVCFAYCQDFYGWNVTITDCWGGSGVMGSLASSRYGWFLENTVHGISNGTRAVFNFFLDGARYVDIINNAGTCDAAFTYESNLDNTEWGVSTAGLCQDCAAVGNIFTNIGSAVGRVAVSIMGGNRIKIRDNEFTAAAGHYFYILFRVYTRSPDGTGRTDDCEFINNTLTGSALCYGPFWIWGAATDENIPGSGPVNIERLQYQDNTIVAYSKRGWFYNQYCVDMIISGNSYPGATVYHYEIASDEAVIVANNTLQ